jgi:hypothetical protein
VEVGATARPNQRPPGGGRHRVVRMQARARMERGRRWRR